MPYKDPERERERQSRRRKPEFEAAAAWADGQVALLKSMGVNHSTKEWRALRSDLLKSRLNKRTVIALTPPPVSTFE